MGVRWKLCNFRSLLPGAGTVAGATKSIMDYAKKGVNKVVDQIGNAFSGLGELVFG